MGPLAAMVTEPLRLWPAEPPFTLGVAATVGTAGVTEGRPFWVEPDEDLACWFAVAEEPATDEGGLAAPVTTNGVEAGFFVAPAAEAYEGADEAAVVFGAGVVLG